MKNLSRFTMKWQASLIYLFFFVVSLFTLHYSLFTAPVQAQEAFPGISFPCDKVNDPEFHSLRPYQAAVCGDANKALYCSNELKFIESFDLTSKCPYKGETSDYWCTPKDGLVDEHNLYVELTDSMFPIMGNTEQVKNYDKKEDEFDDAQKVNEYISWYLSGVNNRAEYGENTDDRVVNFSGPIQKLLPKQIQEAQRIETILTILKEGSAYIDESSGELISSEPLNHDQIVVCGYGSGNAADCSGVYGSLLKKYRLSTWLFGNISFTRTLSNTAINFLSKIPGIGDLVETFATKAWNHRTPPLPWQIVNGKPLTELEYQKAYNEWRGKSCVLIPLINKLFCFDNPGVTNEYADLYQYIPLSNTTDKKGAERILDVMFKPAVKTTVISGEKYDEAGKKNAPLYFAHTQEASESSALLNKTYLPKDYKSEPLPETTEKNVCSAVNVRTNKGDNLFPGDRAETKDEIVIPGVTYNIDQVLCIVTKTRVPVIDPKTKERIGYKDVYTPHCNAEVAIVIPTDVKVPNADEIFATTVADSGSTFRKIFPKVEEGAPVSCIADIPAVTGVTYDAQRSNVPRGGSLEFKVKSFPEDSAGNNLELTFPHIGSVYEYFLKGIQTALRPKGYGEPITDGTLCKPSLACGELPKLPKASGSCNLGGVSSRVGDIPQSLKDIVSAAAETYKVPPNLILGIMFGEGLFKGGNQKDWTDENVKNWATCTKIPGCSETGTDYFMGFNGNVFNNIVSKQSFKDGMKKIDPSRQVFSQCNLLDSISAVAWDLHDSADGGMDFQCFGLDLEAPIPSSCTWNDNQYISAIKIAENGYENGCFTLKNSCATGGGYDALCPGGGDTCETITNRDPSAPSHMGCVFDVAKAK